MHRRFVIKKLQDYFPADQKEISFKDKFIDFINGNSNCFERTLSIGHVTGSAWIVDHSREYALLTHHKKLDRWLQLGGHADGDPDILNVASREAEEESGLNSIKLVGLQIFDIDIHRIPARKDEPEHLHYDIRFLFEADRSEEVQVSAESKAVDWIPLDNVAQLTDYEPSVLRMVKKVVEADTL